jgi:hypothetical protein
VRARSPRKIFHGGQFWLMHVKNHAVLPTI